MIIRLESLNCEKGQCAYFVKCNCNQILIKHITAHRPIRRKRDGGLKTPLEWERGVKLKGDILIIFPTI
jgi:hypothetical protein